jgi:hypothetical protein
VHIDTQILSRSRATERFKDDLRRFVERHEDVPAIVLVHRVPRVKVLRLLHHLLDAHPEFANEPVHKDAR